MKYQTVAALAALGASLALSGCAHDVFNNNPGNSPEVFAQDTAYCKLVAMNAPQQHTPQQPIYNGSSVTTYTGTATASTYGNNTYVNSYGTATTTPTVNSGAQLANGMSALGDAIANAMRQRETMRLCMLSKGYHLQAN